jgi:uncharacterized membrane protein
MDAYVTVLKLVWIYQIFNTVKIIKIIISIIVFIYYISKIKMKFTDVHTMVWNINNKLQKFKIKGYVTKV